jgi:uncharacterized protein YwgA
MNIIKELENSKNKKGLRILPEDTILMLLYSHSDKPIINRTVLMKEVFLTYEEVLKKENGIELLNPEFFGHKFGPFSYRVSEAIWFLVSNGMIQVKGRAKGRKEEFRITEKGIGMIKLLLKKMKKDMVKVLIEDLTNKRKGWDQLGRNGILNYVYKMYENYAEKSKIKEKYGMTIWGELFKE